MQRRHLFAAAVAAGLMLAPALATSAAPKGVVQVQQPWARPTPAGAPVGGGYMTIVNSGRSADRLLGGSSPASGRFEIHEMSMAGGVMSMRRLDKGLEIPPGGTVTLKPGGFHIMFIGLAKPFKLGDRVPATLQFEKAGSVKVEFLVRQPAEVSSGHHGMR